MSDRHKNELSPPKRLLSSMLYNVWHLPDSFGWMAPLPLIHRRWLIILLFVIIILLLIPAPKRAFTLQEHTNKPLQAALIIDGNNSFDNSSSLPIRIINGKPQTENDDLGVWQTLLVQQGQTFIQLFRDSGLRAEDALALAKAEGDDKPLSTLRAGQKIKVKKDESGKVVALDTELPGQQQVFFIRQSDGAFFRYQ